MNYGDQATLSASSPPNVTTAPTSSASATVTFSGSPMVVTRHLNIEAPPVLEWHLPSAGTAATGFAYSHLVFRLLDRNRWVANAQAFVTGLAGLETNWDSYGAEAPTADSRHCADLVLDALWQYGLKPSRVAPTSDSGILISIFGTFGRVTFDCDQDGELLIVLKPTVGERIALELTEDDIVDADGDFLDLIREIAGPAVGHARLG